MVLGTNYAVTRVQARGDYPFGLSFNFREYHRRGEAISPDFLYDLGRDADLTLITDGDPLGNKLGLWDPRMYFAETLQTIHYGKTRYFSVDDYDNKRDAKAVVLHDAYEDVHVDGYIFSITQQSKLYAPKVDEVENLFHLEHLGERVLIDADFPEALGRIERGLIYHGYVEELREQKGFMSALMTAYVQDAYSALVLSIPLGMYLIWAFAVVALFYLHQKKIALSRICGGRFPQIFPHLAAPFLWQQVATILLAFILYYLFRARMGLVAMPALLFVQLLVFHELFCLLLMYLAFVTNQWIVSRREIAYVT